MEELRKSKETPEGLDWYQLAFYLWYDGREGCMDKLDCSLGLIREEHGSLQGARWQKGWDNENGRRFDWCIPQGAGFSSHNSWCLELPASLIFHPILKPGEPRLQLPSICLQQVDARRFKLVSLFLFLPSHVRTSAISIPTRVSRI